MRSQGIEKVIKDFVNLTQKGRDSVTFPLSVENSKL